MSKISKILRNKTLPNCPIHGERELAYDTEEKAEVLPDSIEKQCRNVHDNIDLDHIGKAHKSVRSRLLGDQTSDIDFVTPNEIVKITSKLNIKKAPGPDDIPNAALRQLQNKAIVVLTAIINTCFRLGRFSTTWKEAYVIPIRQEKAGKGRKIRQEKIRSFHKTTGQ